MSSSEESRNGPPSPDDVMLRPALPSTRATRNSSLAAPNEVDA